MNERAVSESSCFSGILFLIMKSLFRAAPDNTQHTEKLNFYLHFKALGLGNYRKDIGVYVSIICTSAFSLQDFVNIRRSFCSIKHNSGQIMCKECATLVRFAQEVQKNCVVELAATYKTSFPLVNQSIRKLMQMPLTVVQMCLNGPGSQKLYLLETMPGVDLPNMIKIAVKCFFLGPLKTGITKAMLQDLCRLTTSESDKPLIKYTCCKGQNLSKKMFSEQYGFSDFNHQESEIISAIDELNEMRNAVELLFA